MSLINFNVPSERKPNIAPQKANPEQFVCDLIASGSLSDYWPKHLDQLRCKENTRLHELLTQLQSQRKIEGYDSYQYEGNSLPLLASVRLVAPVE